MINNQDTVDNSQLSKSPHIAEGSVGAVIVPKCPSAPTHLKACSVRAKRDTFLRALMEIGKIQPASRASGVDHSSIYATMRAEPDFKAAVEEARAIGSGPYVDTLTDEAHRRAVEGIQEPVFYKGERVATVRKYSDNLLMFLIKREDPSYRDSYRAPEDDTGKVNLVDVIAAIQQGAH